MVLPDHIVGITEQSEGCPYSKVTSPRDELRTPVQRVTLSPEKQAAVKIHEQS